MLVAIRHAMGGVGLWEMTEIVQAVKLFSAEWPVARDMWRETDPLLYAVTPPEPVDRLMEVTQTPFGALVRSILHQQVSIFAGRAIVSRLVAAAGGEMDAERTLALSEDDL